MKRNFHAIDAIAFSLGYGFRGIVTALRLGWLTVLLYAFAAYVLMLNGVEWDTDGTAGVIGQFLSGQIAAFLDTLATWIPAVRDIDVSIENDQLAWQAEALTAPIGLAFGAMALANLLFIPALVAMQRRAAGVEARGGILPLFGRPEWCFFAATIITVIVILLAVALFAIPLLGAVYAAEVMENESLGLLAIPAGLLLVFGAVWFSIRISLFPIHAAVTGTLDLGGAFGLTGGRFWKLLGTLVLFGIILATIEYAIAFASTGLVAMDTIWLLLLLTLGYQLYAQVAQAGLFGRITGDLLGTTEADDSPAGDETDSDADDLPEDPSGDDQAEFPPVREAAAPTAVMSRGARPQGARNLAPAAGQVPAAPTASSLAGEPARPAEESPVKPAGSSVSFLRNRFR